MNRFVDSKAPGKPVTLINQNVKDKVMEPSVFSLYGGNDRIETQGPRDNVFYPKPKLAMMSKVFAESKRDSATQLTQMSSPDTGKDLIYRLPLDQRPALDLPSDVKTTLSEMAKRDFGFL